MASRSADAEWSGNLLEGKGRIRVQSGTLDAPYDFRARTGDGKGTNPEELIAAAHAGCFTMALAFQLEKAGFTATQLRTEAAVSLAKDGDGFRINRSALTLSASIPDIDQARFDELAQAAKTGCPVSKLFNTDITLAATLEKGDGGN